MRFKINIAAVIIAAVAVIACFYATFQYAAVRGRLAAYVSKSDMKDKGGSLAYYASSSASAAASSVPSAAGSKTAENLKIALAAKETALMDAGEPKNASLEERASYNVASSDKYVYLTFDDGPSEYTPAVLETLKKNNVKATFFTVYYKNKDYYKQILNDGHTLALHTYSHDYKTVYSSVEAYFSDLKKISDYVKSAVGAESAQVESKIVRLPGGASNTISRRYQKGVITAVTNELEKQGYAFYDWNAQCMDATSKSLAPAKILKNVKSFTTVNGKYKPFVMLLLHNGATEKTTSDALQSIIDYYRQNGYHFEKIRKDTPAVHQPVQN